MNTSSLVPVSIIDYVEAYLVLDKPGYKPGSEARINILMKSIKGEQKKVDVTVKDPQGNIIHSGSIELSSNLTDIDLEYSVPEKPGTYKLVLEVNGKKADEVEYVVYDTSIRKPVLFTIVWHHHQAPNYLPDGRIHGPWAYIYVWGDQLKPYGKGPYHYHAIMLKQHPGFKSTYNLSPSLLAQWRMIVEKGIVFEDGRRYPPDSWEANMVKETLELYREALRRGQIDVLTSIYAHTIAGFLVELLNMDDIVREEISYGMRITREVIGEDYEPKGIWTPEMAFSMKLVPIYNDLGIEYTVLDDKHHYMGAEGDKAGPYQPYLLIDRSTGKHVIVFFRDHVLSDVLGFKNIFNSEIHAWRNAYELSYQILRKWFNAEVKTLVLALDGENWMVFSKTPALTAYFMDKLIVYLETLDDTGFLKLSTLRKIIEEYPPRKILYSIPTNTWLGTFRKWRGEVSDHEKYWVKVYESYRKLKAYERIIMGRDEYCEKIRWALWHALDSGYWWAEFWSPRIIDAWLKQANDVLDDRLSRIRIKDVKTTSESYENTESTIVVEVVNDLNKEAYLTIQLIGSGTMVDEQGKPLRIKPNTRYSREIKYIPKTCGENYIIVNLVSAGYIVDKKQIIINVKPFIRENPI